MTVKDGNKTTKNDDAHYITITSTTCYDSDENGYEASGRFLKFIKNENNLHCYYGLCKWGYAHYYFSSDYSRLNVKANDNMVHVYQCETSGKTTAQMRRESPNGVKVIYSPTPNVNNGGSTSVSSGTSYSRSTPTQSKCKYCGGGGGCSSCKGKGYQFNIYSGHDGDCPSCRGSGRCPICHGTGRL